MVSWRTHESAKPVHAHETVCQRHWIHTKERPDDHEITSEITPPGFVRASYAVAACHYRAPAVAAQGPQPTRQVVYKTVGDVKPSLHLFEPQGHQPADNRPAIVFNFGRNQNRDYDRTVAAMDRFLQSLGFIGSPASGSEQAQADRQDSKTYDVVVYGGTSAA